MIPYSGMDNFLEIFESEVVSADPVNIESINIATKKVYQESIKNYSDVDYVSAITALDILYRLRAGKITGI